MASTDARPVPKKNTAYRHYFAIRKNDGTLITTWAGQDTELSLDGAGFSDATNEATEIGTSGVGYLELSAEEMNYDAVIIKVTVTNTGALPYVVTLFPEEAGDIRTDVTMVSGDGTAADNLELACDNYSATRGLSGTALPAAAADAAGGLPISDAGGLDLDTKLANTHEITAARMPELDAGTAGKMAHQVDIIQTDTTTDIPATLTAMAAVLNVVYTWGAGKVIDKVGSPGTYQVLDPDDDLTVVLEFVLGATTPYKDVTIV